jgi:hypothetical protein
MLTPLSVAFPRNAPMPRMGSRARAPAATILNRRASDRLRCTSAAGLRPETGLHPAS